MSPISSLVAPSCDQAESDAVTQETIASLPVYHIASYRTSTEPRPFGPLLSYASTLSHGPLWYLQTRDGSREILAAGAIATFRADSLADFQHRHSWLIPSLNAHPFAEVLTLVGGTSFDTEAPGASWPGFSAVHFILPRQLHLRRGNVVDVYQFGDDTEGCSSRAGGPIPSRETPTAPFLAPSWVASEPTFDEWEKTLKEALNAIEHGELQKVVLARRALANLNTSIHPALLLQRLLASPQPVAPYLFAPGPKLSPTFIGATPELLFALVQSPSQSPSEQQTLSDSPTSIPSPCITLESEALAGTLSRSPRDTTDSPPAPNLASGCHKERAEHQFVVTSILEKLRTIAVRIEAPPEPQITTLHDLHHLVTPIRADLASPPCPLDIVALLHPTPAVGGTPPQAARSFIRDHEPFERGWYAGTIGYMTNERSEFYVSLRSALLNENELIAYVGAGIVSGSTAVQEWRELDLKQQRLVASVGA